MLQEKFREEAKAAIELAEQLRQKQQESLVDWLDGHEKIRIQEQVAFEMKQKLLKLDSLDDRLNKLKIGTFSTKNSFKSNKRPIIDDEVNDVGTDENDQDGDNFLLEDYFSDEESNSTFEESSLSRNIDSISSSDDFYATKFFYTARTHSQISQFVQELKKTKFARTARVITLASRQTTCLNEKVKRLGHVNLINDACLHMQKQKQEKFKKCLDGTKEQKGKGGCRCPYYRTQAMHQLAERYLCNVQDIEELVESGKAAKCCPYYASRFAVAGADLVLTPYQILLNKSAREACDIRLEGNVVIIDEAHNLIDAINSVHNCKLNARCITISLNCLTAYVKRYGSRLNPSNLMYLKHLNTILKSFAKILSSYDKKSNQQLKSVESGIYKVVDFLFETQIADVNFFKLSRFMVKSKISQKLNGFARSNDSSSASSFCSTVQVESFVKCLASTSKDGRILLHNEDAGSPSLEFLSVNPSVHVRELLKQPRAVVLAGGTMQPVTDIVDQLLKPNGVPADNIDLFSCGHVIPDSNILPLTLGSGPTNRRLEFTYQTRSDVQLIDELGHLLVNLCNIVPGGLVCFFTSYDYEGTVYRRFEYSGILEQIKKRKKVFCESKDASQAVLILEKFIKCTQLPECGVNKNRKYVTWAEVVV